MDSDFLEELKTLKEWVPSEVASNTRGQAHIPKLIYTVSGKWVVVSNHQALSRFTNRSVKFIAKYFASKLGISFLLLL